MKTLRPFGEYYNLLNSSVQQGDRKMIDELDMAWELEQAEFNLHLIERYKDRILAILGDDISVDLRNQLIVSLMKS